MREHPIPQDIVGYRFHIVGNMTIKQFAEIGVGVFIAFLIYQTNLITVIKWPLMGISVAIGAALAFVPFEERPLDHWLTTFIKVLYKPTKFYWKREAVIPDSFLHEAKKKTGKTTIEVDLTPAKRQRIKEYMMSIRQQQFTTFDSEREQSISDIFTTFNQPTNLQKPGLGVRVRSLRQETTSQQNGLDEATIVEEQIVTTVDTETSTYQEQLRESIQLRTPLAVNQVAQDIVVPEQEMITTETQSAPQPEEQVAVQQNTLDERAYVENQQPLVQEQQTQASGVVFNQQLPFPSKPEQPNKLVGMVLTPQNELVNDAIVEIKNQAGATVRAVKTNALGQFFVTTPLNDGTYVLETEKQGLQFSAFTIQLQGTVIDPIEIRSV
jgi:hypothetical protein